MDIWVILILAVASVGGYMLMYLALRNQKLKQKDYQTFAKSQGWVYDHDPATAHSPGIDRFRDPKADWTLELIHAEDADERVVWRTPHGALPGGEAVLGIVLPEKAVAMMQNRGAIGQQMLKAALKATLHALGKTRFNLTIDEATAGDQRWS